MTIYMMRHGKTRANMDKYYATEDESILPVKDEKIRKIANAVEELGFRFIVASPYLRTRQTAKLIGDVLKMPIAVDQKIHEIDLGVLEGKTFKEAYDLYGAALQPWIDDPYTNGPPKGESLEQAYKRGENFLSWAREDTLYVSHDGFIRAVLCARDGHIDNFFRYKIENLEIVRIK